jgi:hypothetical protein
MQLIVEPAMQVAATHRLERLQQHIAQRMQRRRQCEHMTIILHLWCGYTEQAVRLRETLQAWNHRRCQLCIRQWAAAARCVCV